MSRWATAFAITRAREKNLCLACTQLIARRSAPSRLTDFARNEFLSAESFWKELWGTRTIRASVLTPIRETKYLCTAPARVSWILDCRSALYREI